LTGYACQIQSCGMNTLLDALKLLLSHQAIIGSWGDDTMSLFAALINIDAIRLCSTRYADSQRVIHAPCGHVHALSLHGLHLQAVLSRRINLRSGHALLKKHAHCFQFHSSQAKFHPFSSDIVKAPLVPYFLTRGAFSSCPVVWGQFDFFNASSSFSIRRCLHLRSFRQERPRVVHQI